jgi:glycosyltransferase involved in cell wall biosynthesis
LRILFVDASRNGWGTEQHLLSLARALAETGHSISAVVKRDSPVALLLTDGGIRIHETAFRGGADPRGIVKIVQAIRAERPDWIVTNRGKLYWTIWAIARLTGVRVAVFRHLPEVRRWLTRCVLPRLVDRFFVVSEFSRRRLVAQGAPFDRLSVLYNPIDVESLRATSLQRRDIRHRLGIHAGDFVIRFVGRVERDKGVQVLWNVIAPLMPRATHLRFLCVGDGPELIALQREAAALKIDTRCHFVGWTASIGEYYSAMDVLVAPSVALETFCRVVAEAQASRLAVIGTRMGGMAEAFAPGRSGLLIPPNDGRALQRAIKRLHDDPNLRLRFSEAGYNYVRNNFAAHKIAGDFIVALSGPAVAHVALLPAVLDTNASVSP